MATGNCCPPSGTKWNPQEEIHIQGKDCQGNLTDFVGKPNEIMKTVPAIGSVQDVRICNPEILGGGVEAGDKLQLIYYTLPNITGQSSTNTCAFYLRREAIIFNQSTGVIVSSTTEYAHLVQEGAIVPPSWDTIPPLEALC
jgi:hypothetical protein